MGALGTIIFAAVLSSVIASMLQLQLAIWFNAHEEFIVIMMGQSLFVIALAVALLFTLVVFETERAVTRVTLALVVLVVAGVAGIEAIALVNGGAQALANVVSVEGPIMLEIVAPALLAAFIQWWLVRRHVRRRELGTAHG